MREIDKIIKALETCAAGKPCDKCPLKNECSGTVNAAMAGAIKLLVDQRKRIDRLMFTLEVLLDEKKDEETEPGTDGSGSTGS